MAHTNHLAQRIPQASLGWLRPAYRAGWLLLIALALPASLSGQSSASSAAGRAAQFVFVVDDSGSMQDTDPDRLSVFAVRSLLSMLGDRDEVSVVRLNGPSEGAQIPPIRPLRETRQSILNLLTLDGALASYRAPHTRCSSALSAVKELLNQAYRPEVAQVVFFLTDGACEPRSEEIQAGAFLDGLRAAADHAFQFYLLRFRGLDSSPSLADLAKRTGGGSLEVAGADPTSILQPFAQALSRSQGYESYLLTPDRSHLAAHRGAERVRLLAVAPDPGVPLEFQIHDQNGGSPARLRQRTETGTHRYPNGRVFRFASLDYRPGTAPVTVSVTGSSAWKIVALPEYHLKVFGRMTSGRCEGDGPLVQAAAGTGSDVCIHVELVNASGETVGGEVAPGDLSALVRQRRPDHPETAESEMAANPRPGGEAHFVLQRPGLAAGDYEFEPAVRLRLSTGEAILVGRRMSLAVHSLSIAPAPDRLDFQKPMLPGERRLAPLRFVGSFPESPGRLEIADRSRLPPCVSVTLSGVPEGRAQPIRQDQTYQLGLRTASYCGPRSFSRSFEGVVRLSFDDDPKGAALTAVELPVRFSLDYRIEFPPELALRVRGGEGADVALPIRSNARSPLTLRALLRPPGEAEAWPGDRSDLSLGFAASRGRLMTEGGKPVLSRIWRAAPGMADGDSLHLRALAGSCCAGGDYRTELGLLAAESTPGMPSAEPIRIPVHLHVEPAGPWACYGPWILWALAGILLLLLLLYAVGMFRHTRLLSAEQLSSRLLPLVWTDYGDAIEKRSSKVEVERMVRRGLAPWPRVAAWIRSNPLRFGLPGGQYSETVELFLQPHNDLARSQVALAAEPELAAKAEREPAAYAGRLFATALGGTTVFGVPDVGGKISRMGRFESWSSAGGADEAKPKVIKLRKAKLLRPLEDWETREEGAAAGWQVG
jgi:Mg-chelatase subunit ChlD